MRSRTAFLKYLFCFWMLVFIAFRACFYMFNNEFSIETIQAFGRGILLDISAASYFLMIPLIFWIVGTIKASDQVLKRASRLFNYTLLLCVVIVETVSIPLYRQWGTVVNGRALSYLNNLKEAINTSAVYASPILLLLMTTAIILGIFTLNWIYRKKYVKLELNWHAVPGILLILSLLFLGARGGIGKTPINISSSFYSLDQSNNYLAVNKTRYLINSISMRKHLSVEDRNYNEQDLLKFYNRLYGEESKDSVQDLLITAKPNIVFVILEGMPADVFDGLGGPYNITPNFSKLQEEGLLFTQIFSSGTRTDQGLLSILSGVPALPYIQLMNDIEKTKKFPSLLKTLKNEGYATSFIYGGDLDFNNFNSYFLLNKTDKIIGQNSFLDSDNTISWGVADDKCYERALIEMDEDTPPFFTCILSQSSHPPFDIQGAKKYGDSNNVAKFMSSIHYADSSLFSFIEQAKKRTWYDNSLFVILSDHGSLHLGNRHYNEHRRFQVPLLFYGPALNPNLKGKAIGQIGNHHDVAGTLLPALGLLNEEFILSKNLMKVNAQSPGYWITEHSLGWIKEDQRIVINYDSGELYFADEPEKDNTSQISDALKYYKLVSDYSLSEQKTY